MNSKQILVILLSTFGVLASAANVRHRTSSSSGTGAGVRVYSHQTPVEEVVEVEEVVRPKLVQTEDYSREYTTTKVKAPTTSYSSGGSGYAQHNTRVKEDQAEEDDHRAKSAKYSFASAVDDGIMDQSQVRQEVRDGLKVTGSYSYSDGFFKRTYKYEADEKGYRVVEEDIEPIGGGPQVDLVNGKADVHTQVGGVDTVYSITSDDIGRMNPKEVKVLKAHTHTHNKEILKEKY